MGFLEQGNISLKSFQVVKYFESLKGRPKPFHVERGDFQVGEVMCELWEVLLFTSSGDPRRKEDLSLCVRMC